MGKRDSLCQLLCIYFYLSASVLCPSLYIDRPLPQNSITWDLLPVGISLVSTNWRHYQEKRVRYIYQIPFFYFTSLPPNDFHNGCVPLHVFLYYWADYFPQLHLSLGSDTLKSYSYPIRHGSNNHFPLLWALECFTIPFCHLFILPTSSKLVPSFNSIN